MVERQAGIGVFSQEFQSVSLDSSGCLGTCFRQSTGIVRIADFGP